MKQLLIKMLAVMAIVAVSTTTMLAGLFSCKKDGTNPCGTCTNCTYWVFCSIGFSDSWWESGNGSTPGNEYPICVATTSGGERLCRIHYDPCPSLVEFNVPLCGGRRTHKTDWSGPYVGCKAWGPGCS